MRLSMTAFALSSLVVLGACGDDPEPVQDAAPTRPAPTQRPVTDTMRADTARPAGQAGAAADGAAEERPDGGTEDRARAGEPEDVAAPTGTGEADGASMPSARLYTVQVAAFTSPEPARMWTGRLNSLDLPTWTSVAELGGTTYYRVRVGAVPTVTEARRLGSLLSGRFEWPVWVAPITGADPLPDDVVAATRQVLGDD